MRIPSKFEIAVHDNDPQFCSKDCRFCKLETDSDNELVKVYYKCRMYDVTWQNTDVPLARPQECVRENGNGDNKR